ncbi:MAG: Xaa-Pro peptidase family protein [Ignavibacteria bacterium]|nr:Xaa-Pro peptidase family protein [Ignavibacteria bacterium]MBT8383653.1 Xaa-Pro peptidase family protein [Ignavibacteria bacterium]MBT8391362.1 Xaa-Pro peptidase family protein [Ignavibacteria bacterium]NNL21717.1 aminopeptidase P family protein [Ignavibacteriaceae bacterium]
MLIKEKVNQAKNLLKEFNVDCWITFVRESQINGDPTLAFLVTADVTWHSAFIITKDEKAIAIVGRYDKQTVEDTGAYDEVISFVEGIKDPFLKLMKEINPRQIALNFSEGSEIADGITHGMFLTMKDFLKDIGIDDRIISAQKIVSALRERKTTTEIQNIKAAIKHTEEIFTLVSRFIKPGKTEKEIAAFMTDEVKKRNLEFAWEPTVCPAVFTGPETAEAHYSPTDKKVERGHVLNMDFGVKVNGYCSDLQRTFYVLEENENAAPADVQKGFDTIVESIERSKQAMKPDMVAKDIDAIARNVVVENGYEEFPHGLGHQVGRFSHDGTALLGPPWEKYAQKPFQLLEEGMVFTIEPRLNVENRGIATIEEMVVVTKTGADWLSTPQKELILIK